ncbi:MAG: hypothetical protein ACI9SY_000047 [Candidatus Paceibacteria bacterium]|jgi:hypothetical protein
MSKDVILGGRTFLGDHKSRKSAESSTNAKLGVVRPFSVETSRDDNGEVVAWKRIEGFSVWI